MTRDSSVVNLITNRIVCRLQVGDASLLVYQLSMVVQYQSRDTQ
jgi:hypothetical protein